MDPAFHELRSWNEGRVLGAKRALKPQQVRAIRFWLDQHRRLRERVLFDFAIDSKLRGCDVAKVRIGDIVAGGRIRDRAVVVQQKTKRPVQFELVEPARKTLLAWLDPQVHDNLSRQSLSSAAFLRWDGHTDKVFWNRRLMTQPPKFRRFKFDR